LIGVSGDKYRRSSGIADPLEVNVIGNHLSFPVGSVIWLGGNEAPARHQFVALNAGVVVNGPFVATESLGEVKGQPVETWCILRL
jgi:hypothetical protein